MLTLEWSAGDTILGPGAGRSQSKHETTAKYSYGSSKETIPLAHSSAVRTRLGGPVTRICTDGQERWNCGFPFTDV